VRRLLCGLLLLGCLAVAACADTNQRSDDNKFNGFYGGFSGGAIP